MEEKMSVKMRIQSRQIISNQDADFYGATDDIRPTPEIQAKSCNIVTETQR